MYLNLKLRLASNVSLAFLSMSAIMLLTEATTPSCDNKSRLLELNGKNFRRPSRVLRMRPWQLCLLGVHGDIWMYAGSSGFLSPGSGVPFYFTQKGRVECPRCD